VAVAAIAIRRILEQLGQRDAALDDRLRRLGVGR
jgi:hypothetical protein